MYVYNRDGPHAWSLSFLEYILAKNPCDNREHKRQKALVILALIKLENGVDVPRSGEIVEDYLVRSDAHNGAVFCE